VLLGAIVFILISGRVVGSSYRLIEKQRQELAIFNRELEQRVEDRTKQLEEQFIKVSTLNKAMEMEMGERKKAEDKYRAIFENATEGIFQTSPAGQIISANRAMARILGYETPEELQASIKHLAKDFYTDAARRDEAYSLMERHGSISEFEISARGKNGTPIWVSISARLVRDAENNAVLCEGTLHDIMDRKRAEAEREELQKRLLGISRQAGMAEVATGVLHNVGNVLNSVNVATAVVCEKLKKSQVSRLTQAAQMLSSHSTDLGDFLTKDERGRKLPKFIVDLADFLTGENKAVRDEMQNVSKHIEHIKEIVNLQQAYAGVSSILEPLDLRDLVEDSVKMNEEALTRHDVQIVREFDEIPATPADRHKVLQILVNLINNAKAAMAESNPKIITFTTHLADDGRVRVSVRDTGCGISNENLNRIFSHGFTTKSDGHGFGLHSSILAANEMKAALTVQSDGPGCGATFTLEFQAATVESGDLKTQALARA
jgi:PAS domain S-box-containing protein